MICGRLVVPVRRAAAVLHGEIDEQALGEEKEESPDERGSSGRRRRPGPPARKPRRTQGVVHHSPLPRCPGVLPYLLQSPARSAASRIRVTAPAAFMTFLAYERVLLPDRVVLETVHKNAFRGGRCADFPLRRLDQGESQVHGGDLDPVQVPGDRAVGGKDDRHVRVGVFLPDFRVPEPDGLRQPSDRSGEPAQEGPAVVGVRQPGMKRCVSSALARTFSGLSSGLMLTVTTR